MADFWGVLGALAVFVLPLLLARWLLERADPPQDGLAKRHGKMPSAKEDDTC